MKKLTGDDQKFDSIDRALICALHSNARASLRALSREIGLSAPGCTERLKRLENAGVIAGFSVDLDAEALGFPLQSMVRVKPFPGKLLEVEKLLREMPENIACFKVTGDDGFVCHLYLRSVSHLDEVLHRIIKFADTNTSIIKMVERKLPPLKVSK
ncbi:Lrp/AsnC family transcriptional regulator [Pseudomonas mandelii]|uniref:Lrp/AsnC family transcriptional regulator n=1 Tax=Pseudomonas mandelii TaxID=75612 RepID=UPI00224AA03B|nr:Lrp/AsnC family transcriptional regulator [Pseudomonas mandelii]MCX2901284.1 Lrp/AsnC family transcriptional regulator [Pseudomonas mandelii]